MSAGRVGGTCSTTTYRPGAAPQRAEETARALCCLPPPRTTPHALPCHVPPLSFPPNCTHRFQSTVQQMSAEELAELLSNPALREDVQLVDVREQWEWDTAHVEGFKLLPLSQFSSWAGGITTVLDPAKETVVLCHHGVRSMQMAQVGEPAGGWGCWEGVWRCGILLAGIGCGESGGGWVDTAMPWGSGLHADGAGGDT